jgi:hypothetical protein
MMLTAGVLYKGYKLFREFISNRKQKPITSLDPFVLDLTTKLTHVVGGFSIHADKHNIVATDTDLNTFVTKLDNTCLTHMDLNAMVGAITTTSVVTRMSNGHHIEFLNFSNTAYNGIPKYAHMLEELTRLAARYKHELIEDIFVTKTLIENGITESSFVERYSFEGITYGNLVDAITDHYVEICKAGDFAESITDDQLGTYGKSTCLLILSKFAKVRFVDDLLDGFDVEDSRLLIIIEENDLMVDVSNHDELKHAIDLYKHDKIIGLFRKRGTSAEWLLISGNKEFTYGDIALIDKNDNQRSHVE